MVSTADVASSATLFIYFYPVALRTTKKGPLTRVHRPCPQGAQLVICHLAHNDRKTLLKVPPEWRSIVPNADWVRLLLPLHCQSLNLTW